MEMEKCFLTHYTEEQTEEAPRKPVMLVMHQVTKQSGAKIRFKSCSAWLQSWGPDPCAPPTLLKTPEGPPSMLPLPCTPRPVAHGLGRPLAREAEFAQAGEVDRAHSPPPPRGTYAGQSPFSRPTRGHTPALLPL